MRKLYRLKKPPIETVKYDNNTIDMIIETSSNEREDNVQNPTAIETTPKSTQMKLQTKTAMRVSDVIRIIRIIRIEVKSFNDHQAMYNHNKSKITKKNIYRIDLSRVGAAILNGR